MGNNTIGMVVKTAVVKLLILWVRQVLMNDNSKCVGRTSFHKTEHRGVAHVLNSVALTVYEIDYCP